MEWFISTEEANHMTGIVLDLTSLTMVMIICHTVSACRSQHLQSRLT